MAALTFLPGLQNYPGFSLQRSARLRGSSVYSRSLEKRVGVIRTDSYCEEWRMPSIAGVPFSPQGLASFEDRLYVSSTSSMVAVFRETLKEGVFLFDANGILSLTSYTIATDDGEGVWVRCKHGGDDPTDPADNRYGLARITMNAPNEYVADYYLLPDGFLSPFGLWPNRQGRELWFSVLNVNTYGTGYMLGRLDTVQNGVTGFTFDYSGRPACIDVLGADGGATIWLTESDPTLGVPRFNLYEFRPEAGQAAVYSDGAVQNPRDLAMDASGGVWFTSWDGHVNHVAGGATGRVRVSQRSLDVIHGQVRLKAVTGYPELYADFRVSAIDHAVAATQEGPFKRWFVPGGGARPATPDVTEDGVVYFADPNTDAIGRLTP
eukprot:g414.t1